MLAICCSPVAGVPMPGPLSRTGPRHDLADSTGLEDVYEDAFEDVFREEDRPTTGTVLDETELDIIRRSIARGLGLERIPDPSKVSSRSSPSYRSLRESEEFFAGETLASLVKHSCLVYLLD